MNFTETGIFQQQKVKIRNLLPKIGIQQTRKEIVGGLTAKTPYISSKFFYDALGSALFEEITNLEEYYPTRTEKAILKEIAPELMNRNSSFEIIELGSGDCSKVSILLEAVKKQNLEKIKYIPVDFSQSAIEDSVIELQERFPMLQIDGYVADFKHQINVIPHSKKTRIICFLGSTIGNFLQEEAKEMFATLAKGVLEKDSLLIGFDMEKPESILHAAYNDSKRVTEKFNTNILNVVNRIIKSDFCQEDFNHSAFLNKSKSRIEMHLIANKNTTINSPFFDAPVNFKEGVSIHTENSHKYTFETIKELILGTGLSIKNVFTDSNNWFALVEFGR